MRLLFLSGLVLCFVYNTVAQILPGRDYTFLSSGNIAADKNFYLLTAIQADNNIAGLIRGDEILAKIFERQSHVMKIHIADTCTMPQTLLNDFRFTTSDSVVIAKALGLLYDKHKVAFDQLINKNIRPSGRYQLFAQDNNKILLLKSWSLCALGINYMIEQFGMGKRMRYPNIDSATYDVNTPGFKITVKSMFPYLSEKKMTPLFFMPSLAVALQLMEINERDEPARFEPLQSGENASAFRQVAQTDFTKYQYAALLVLGHSPDIYTVKISPLAKMRCDMVAERYQRGLAPFIITSGGFCAPFRPPNCEALEMKRYLMQRHKIPESAIIIDPYARHTTTNIRNANRLMFYYNFPADRPVMVITSKEHTDYILNERIGYSSFDERFLKELGYLPYHNKIRKGTHETSYYPDIMSLHRDPTDPLDP